MINVFPSGSVPAFKIWFNDRGFGSSDPRVTELLEDVDEEGEPGNDGSEIIAIVIETCRREGLEYVDDMNIYECGFIEEDGAVLVSDWIELAKKFYGR